MWVQRSFDVESNKWVLLRCVFALHNRSCIYSMARFASSAQFLHRNDDDIFFFYSDSELKRQVCSIFDTADV